ncbi:MAG: sodium:solute symporter family protein, partial [Candidatus Hydrogenedentes bacterium]|nr:sodium:solute symporter family protein [Candidatus Hydrogenedentota bacterium]
TPFYWLIAPVFRRMRAITAGDYFEYRYDRSVAGLYALVGVLQLTVNIGVLLKGAGATIEAVSNGAITTNAAILVMTVLFVIYGIAGGLAAAIVTDFIQGILTIILSFIILPFAWKAVGGMAGMREHITNENMFSLVAPGEINGFHIFMFGLSALIGIVTQPHIMGVCAGGRNEMDGRVGFTGGNLLKRVCTIAWMLTGLCAVVYFAGREAEIHPDLIYGTMARELLPLVMPGLVGLFLAALLASIMSSCDAFMVSSAGLFTQNFYRRFIAHDRDEKHYVMVGRITAFVIVVFSIAFSFMFTSVPVALEWFFRVQAVMGAAFWLGLFWRRTTVAGAWAGTLIALAVLMFTSDLTVKEFALYDTTTVTREVVVDGAPQMIEEETLEKGRVVWPETTLWSFSDRFADSMPAYMLWPEPPEPGAAPDPEAAPPRFRISWQILMYLSVGFITCFVVSLFTRRVSEEKLDRIYACLRTPIQPNEPHLDEPFSLPPGVVPPPPKKLINHPDWEIPAPSFVGMTGFLCFCLLVAGMIGMVYTIALVPLETIDTMGTVIGVVVTLGFTAAMAVARKFAVRASESYVVTGLAALVMSLSAMMVLVALMMLGLAQPVWVWTTWAVVGLACARYSYVVVTRSAIPTVPEVEDE